MAKKEEKPDTIKQLFGYAGNYRYLTIASWVLATISAFVALVPFYFIWRLIKEVLRLWQCAEPVCIWLECRCICNRSNAYIHRCIDVFASVSIQDSGQYAL